MSESLELPSGCLQKQVQVKSEEDAEEYVTLYRKPVPLCCSPVELIYGCNYLIAGYVTIYDEHIQALVYCI